MHLKSLVLCSLLTIVGCTPIDRTEPTESIEQNGTVLETPLPEADLKEVGLQGMVFESPYYRAHAMYLIGCSADGASVSFTRTAWGGAILFEDVEPGETFSMEYDEKIWVTIKVMSVSDCVATVEVTHHEGDN